MARPRAYILGKAGSRRDRKSTRLNSSHLVISYAVFCLKKKNGRELEPALRAGPPQLSPAPGPPVRVAAAGDHGVAARWRKSHGRGLRGLAWLRQTTDEP